MGVPNGSMEDYAATRDTEETKETKEKTQEDK